MNPTIEEICNAADYTNLWPMLQSHDGALCRQLLPKHYQCPISHVAPEFAATQLFASIEADEDSSANLAARYAAITAARLIENGMPTYFVSQDFLQAMMMSDLQGIEWEDIRWPIPSALFILPHGVFQTPDDGDLGFLAIARNDADVPFAMKGRSYAAKNSSIVVCGAATQGVMPLFGTNVAETDFAHFENYPDILEYDEELTETPFGWMLQQVPHSVADKQFEFRMVRIALSLMMAMDIRPDLRKEGEILPSPSSNQRKSKSERVWSPNWLGRDFKLQRSNLPDGGGKSSPRLHWRRGHVRRVVCSPGQTPKTIWVEPTLVG